MAGMKEGPSTSPEGSARALWLTLALVVGALASRPWLGHSEFDATNDACLYVITARSIAAGEGYTYLGAPFTVRPPGFSILIAPLIRAFGTDFGVLNLAVSLTGVLCIVFLFAFLRPRVGDVIAFLVAAAVWLDPTFQASCNQVMSDVPGVALTLACLLMARRADARPSVRTDVLLGLAIGLSGLVRTAVVLVLPAVLCARFARAALDARGVPPLRGALWRGAAILIAATVLAQLPWIVRNAGVTIPVPAEDTFMHSYGTAMLHVDPGDPGSPRVTFADLVERVKERTPQVLSTVGSRLERVNGTTLDVTLGAALILASLVLLIRHRRASDFLVIGTTVVLCTYFAYRGRLAIPLYVLGLAAFVELVWQGARRAFGERARWGIAALLVALIVPHAGPARMKSTMARENGAVRAVVDVLRRTAPADAQLAGSPNGYLFQVFMEEREIFSLLPSIRRGGAQGLRSFVVRRGIDYCVLSPAHHGVARLLPTELVADVGGWRIVRIE